MFSSIFIVRENKVTYFLDLRLIGRNMAILVVFGQSLSLLIVTKWEIIEMCTGKVSSSVELKYAITYLSQTKIQRGWWSAEVLTYFQV